MFGGLFNVAAPARGGWWKQLWRYPAYPWSRCTKEGTPGLDRRSLCSLQCSHIDTSSSDQTQFSHSQTLSSRSEENGTGRNSGGEKTRKNRSLSRCAVRIMLQLTSCPVFSHEWKIIGNGKKHHQDTPGCWCTPSADHGDAPLPHT